MSGSRKSSDGKTRYAWNDEIPPAVGSEDESEVTSTTTDRHLASRTDEMGAAGGASSERWTARHFDVATRLASLEEAIGRAARARAAERAPVSSHLRRLTGGLGAVRDSLYEVTREGERCARPLVGRAQAFAEYVDCVFWWFSDLLGELRRVVTEGASLEAVATFSSEYTLTRIIPLHEALSEISAAGDLASFRVSCAALHEDVLWVEWHLKER